MNIINIEFSHREKAKCITVDNKSSCYLINEFITTHNSKGTRATIGINNDALRLQKTWMLTPKVRLDENENEIKTLTLRTIRSLGYLEELYEFNSDGNFDRVSAMGMVMILRQDRFKITESLSSEKNKDYIEEDKFIKDNYDSFIEQYKNTKEKDYL